MRSVCYLVALLLGLSLDAADHIVSVDTGQLAGSVTVDGVRSFKGIPYAAPPVGELRWRAPEEPPAWEGVRAASEFGAICPQTTQLAAMSGGVLPQTDEDCLFLNVWTAATSRDDPFPVLVWIHGGALNLGWSHQAVYNGHELAKRGVVLVSINYRLGPLGYLAHPALSEEAGVSGNYGFLDQIAALQWVARNIHAFGGDPQRVTIFGESAGGTSVLTLLGSAATTGLVHRAIAQSPWFTEDNVARLTGPSSAEAAGLAWAAEIAPGKDLPALRQMPADDLVGDGKLQLPMHVTVDGAFLPRSPESIFTRGEQHDVPLIVGTNADEGSMFVNMQGFVDRADYERGLKERYGDAATGVVTLYAAQDGSAFRGAVSQWLTDTWILRAARAFLDGAAERSASVYQYHFTRAVPGNPFGAHHGAELRYVFNNLGDQGPMGGATESVDLALAETMVAYWVQFAKTGNPNRRGLVPWPQYGHARAYLDLGDTVTPGRALGQRRLDRLESILGPIR